MEVAVTKNPNNVAETLAITESSEWAADSFDDIPTHAIAKYSINRKL
jgi:hypothetical protein